MAAPWAYLSVNGLVVSVHNTVIAGLLGAALLAALRSSLLVQLLGHGVEGLLDFLGRSLDGGYVVALVDFLQVVNGTLDGGLLTCVNLVAQLVQQIPTVDRAT